MSKDKDETQDLDLIDAYVEGSKGVNECLTINYIDGEHIELCAVPFKIALGRKVEWGPLVHSDDIEVLRNSEYVTAAQEVLAQEVGNLPEDLETFHLALTVGLHDSAGFFIQYGF